MRFIDVFFKLYGLKRILKFKVHHKKRNIDITQIISELNELDKNIKQTDNKCYNFIVLIVPYGISLIYSCLVLFIILWPFIYSIALSIIHETASYVLLQLFTLVYVSQFITGYLYYNSEGYSKMIRRNRKYQNTIIGLLCAGFAVSLLLAILMTILIGLGFKMDIFNILADTMNLQGKIFFYILIFLTLFYSYNIFITNLIIFSSVLIIHCSELKMYENKFNEYINDYKNEITLMSIIQDYNYLMTINNESINDLNNMFSSMTIIGGISVYFLVLLYSFKDYCISNFVDIVIYAIVEIIYFYTIYLLKNHVQNIISLGTSPKFMNRFLSRTRLYNFGGQEIEQVNDIVTLESINFHVKTLQDLGLRTMIRTLENTNGIDWLILDAIFGEQWDNFQLFGFNINDATIIKKILAIVFGYFFISQASTYWNIQL